MTTSAAMPPRVVSALTLLVLAAHLWLLQGAPARVRSVEPARVPTFAIRSIAAAAVVHEVAPVRASAPPRAVRSARPGAPRARIAGTRAPDGGQAQPAAPPITSDMAPSTFSIPPPVQLRYQVTAVARHRSIQGTSELQWTHQDGTYEASFELAVEGLPPRRQHSAGRLTDAGLEPRRFAERTRGEQAVHFEREAGRVSFSNNRPAAALLAGTQDRLSVLLQLSAMFAGDPAGFPVGTSIEIPTATTREAAPWLFTVEALEQLRLPAAEMTTVKLVRPPRGEYDQRMEIWLAPGEDYVPVRLRLTQPNGDWVDHQWSATDRR